MKLIKKITSILFLAFVVTNLSAQRFKIVEGDLSFLRGETSINVEYAYDGMSVGKFATEKEYVDSKISDYNSKKPGKGDAWAKAWVADRTTRFQPSFKELFEQYSGLSVRPTSKYTLIFKTTSTEPGYNIYISRKNAEISGEAWLVLTSDKTKKLAVITVYRSPGRTFGGEDYDSGLRISEAYACAGKKLGKFMKKSIK